ncbi:MAG: NusA-like transcription termination signal-binding factor [Nanoarchaeota archaeon]|nr:NusA-like transcription termination signal-binding factor [Nanoarchaeota archaeon]
MANKIKLSIEDIGLITSFENLTGASVKDCIVDKEKDKITFIVAEGQAGIAIGKGGMNIKRFSEKLKKKIEVLEFSSDPLKFVANIFRPIKLKNAYIAEKSDGTKVLYVSPVRDKLGMIKAKLKSTRGLIKKYFGIDEVVLQ